MNITQIIDRIRSQVDDPAILKYTDTAICNQVDEQLRIMVRSMARTTKDWHNFTIGLMKADARQLFQGTFEYVLPTWVERVTRVFHRQQTAATETTFSPYRWTSSETAVLGAELEKGDAGRRSGWTWEGQRTLRLWNMAEAMDLTLQVVKLPPPMFKAKLATAYTDATALYLPTTTAVGAGNGLILGEHYPEEGAYVNAELQVTTTSSSTSTNLGEIRRVIYSNAKTIVTGTRQTVLHTDREWLSTLAITDIVETMLPIPTSFSRLLQLMVIRALAVRKGNKELQQTLGPEIAGEMVQFLDWAGSPKDTSGPYYKTSQMGRVGQYDNNRLNPIRVNW